MIDVTTVRTRPADQLTLLVSLHFWLFYAAITQAKNTTQQARPEDG